MSYLLRRKFIVIGGVWPALGQISPRTTSGMNVRADIQQLSRILMPEALELSMLALRKGAVFLQLILAFSTTHGTTLAAQGLQAHGMVYRQWILAFWMTYGLHSHHPRPFDRY